MGRRAFASVVTLSAAVGICVPVFAHAQQDQKRPHLQSFLSRRTHQKTRERISEYCRAAS